MNGNAAYQQMHVKNDGFLKKLLQSRESCPGTDLRDPEQDSETLLQYIQQAREDWISSLSNFEQAEDEELIDYYIYKMKACQVRYNYLLKKAKEIGLKQDIHCL